MPLPQDFDVFSEITGIQIIARGVGVDARHYLNRMYGRGRAHRAPGKMKGGLGFVSNHKSVSALVREWLDERLDLPVYPLARALGYALKPADFTADQPDEIKFMTVNLPAIR